MGVFRIVTMLERDSIVRCVKATYSYKDGDAKEYMFIGDAPESLKNFPAA